MPRFARAGAAPALTITNGTCISQSRFSSSRTPWNPIMPCAAFLLSCDIINVLHTPAMKHRHAVLRFQKLQASSIAHSTPPTGAPKAALMPAAAPALTNSRWSFGFGCYGCLQVGAARLESISGRRYTRPTRLAWQFGSRCCCMFCRRCCSCCSSCPGTERGDQPPVPTCVADDVVQDLHFLKHLLLVALQPPAPKAAQPPAGAEAGCGAGGWGGWGSSYNHEAG